MTAPTPTLVAFSRFGLGPDPTGGSLGSDPRARVEAQIGVSPSVGLDPRLLATHENMKNWRADRDAAQERKRKVVAALRMKEAAAGGAMLPSTISAPTGATPVMTAPSPSGMAASAMAPAPPAGQMPSAAPPAARPVWSNPEQELRFRVQRLLQVGDALPERLVLYWSNHFTVATGKSSILALIGPYEREALRPHIYGPFRELLFRAVTHPAMLRYLDNDESIGPNSPAGKSSKRGINENLAREILELHTLGVDGGYTQKDVQALAAVLSGWVMVNVVNANIYGETFFQPKRHEPGPQVILGRTYRDTGATQLRHVLDDLARHPSTARYVAHRMCRSFISEDPPPALVARMAETFRRTDGNLAEVTRTLVTSDEAWNAPLRKIRPPIELIYVVSRLLKADPPEPPPEQAALAMGQPYFGARSPKGWPEEDVAWATADGIKTRLDWARAVAAHYHPHQDVRALMSGPLAGIVGDETRTAVLRAESQEQALTLLIMSPELQRR